MNIYLVTLNAAINSRRHIRGRHLLKSLIEKCGAYSRAALNRVFTVFWKPNKFVMEK